MSKQQNLWHQLLLLESDWCWSDKFLIIPTEHLLFLQRVGNMNDPLAFTFDENDINQGDPLMYQFDDDFMETTATFKIFIELVERT